MELAAEVASYTLLLGCALRLACAEILAQAVLLLVRKAQFLLHLSRVHRNTSRRKLEPLPPSQSHPLFCPTTVKPISSKPINVLPNVVRTRSTTEKRQTHPTSPPDLLPSSFLSPRTQS